MRIMEEEKIYFRGESLDLETTASWVLMIDSTLMDALLLDAVHLFPTQSLY